MITSKLLEARENAQENAQEHANDQLAVVFNSAPDWLRGFGEFSGTVTEQV